MQVTKVQIKNFLTLGEAEVELGNRGLLLIQGSNNDDSSADSNGAGKSSVVDAVCWGLYGETARGVAADGVINRAAKKGCVVTITLQDEGGNEWQVMRTRKPNSLELTSKSLSSGPANLTKGTEKETQVLIDKIMGCSLEVFRAAVYAGQESMPDLPGMTDKQLKVLIEEAAGVEQLTEAYALARTELTNATGRRGMARANVLSLDTAIANCKSRIDGLEQKVLDWEKGRVTELTDIVALAKTHQATIASAQTLLASLDVPALHAQKAANDGKVAGITAEKTKLKVLQNAESAAKSSLARSLAIYETAKKAVERAQASLDTVGTRVGKPCGECGKPYCEDDLAAAKQAAQTALDERKSEQAQAANLVREAKKAHDEAATEADFYSSGMTDPAAALSADAAIQVKLREAKDLSDKINWMKAEIDRIVQEAKKLKAAENPYDPLLKDERRNLIDLQMKLKAAEDHNDAMSDQEAVISDAVDVFGPAGVRAHILDTVTPFLNERTAEYLGALSDGAITAVWSTLTKNAKGELREKFSIEVTHSKGGDSFAALSGGEKRKVRLATAMALQDLVATRATKPINLFIADEVDHALDESGLERLMGVLERKARERGTVLVISHNSLSDWIDNVVTVVKDGGTSRLEGATRG